MSTVRVKFTETRTTREDDPQTFEAGQEYDLVPTSAERWIRRGCAVIADKPKAASDAGASDKPANKRASKSGGSKGSAAN